MALDCFFFLPEVASDPCSCETPCGEERQPQEKLFQFPAAQIEAKDKRTKPRPTTFAGDGRTTDGASRPVP